MNFLNEYFSYFVVIYSCIFLLVRILIYLEIIYFGKKTIAWAYGRLDLGFWLKIQIDSFNDVNVLNVTKNWPDGHKV